MKSPITLTATKIWREKRIGLLGGTFNPPHKGHFHIANNALKMLKLDAVWWLVTPQNPLKSTPAPPTSSRIALCNEIINNHPSHLATDIEIELGTQTSFQTLRALKYHFPKTDFVWIMGMDNANSFHRWSNWRDILDEVPVYCVSRPPAENTVKMAPLKLQKTLQHTILTKPTHADLTPNQCFWHQTAPLMPQSSRAIRSARSNEQTS